ncbi:thioredoxin [Plectonema cf. radiosum LEGE 06105]|uniref:Thioredoxin n=1 Tax=Plectonema cf. radiosum LEGE 06105 TaxID=945769 RepID=A0A8J7EZX9_9CYAN|nr:thioredoxin [Plectonema radiosum]MBE9213336.1 thioredoxin [Plectonema cf. radiosum LEGE 06105]
MTTVTQVKETEFETLLKSENILVVDFTATWCGPCRVVAPLIQQLAQEYPEDIKVVKIDVDQDKPLAKKYEVRSIPAVLIFKNGELVENLVGAKPYEEFSDAVKKNL